MRISKERRKSLDRQFSEIDAAALVVPDGGWLRAVRVALGMSTRQLGIRAGMSGSAIAKIERSEAAGAAQMATLRRIAEALECDLVYAIVPRTGIEHMVRRRAHELATSEVHAVNRSMQLEGLHVPADYLAAQIDEYAERLVDSPALWR